MMGVVKRFFCVLYVMSKFLIRCVITKYILAVPSHALLCSLTQAHMHDCTQLHHITASSHHTVTLQQVSDAASYAASHA